MNWHLVVDRIIPGNPYRPFSARPFLVIDWMTAGVTVSQVTAAQGSPVVLQSQFAAWPDGLDPLNAPEDAGRWLRSTCAHFGMSATAAAISVCRRDLTVKLLPLPRVSDDELPALVALQVEARTHVTGESVAWDCLLHPALPDDEQRYVTLVTIPERVCTAVSAAARVAGWSQLVVTSGDLLLNCLQPATAGHWQVHVQANQHKLEVLLSHREQSVASWATAMPTDDPGSAAALVQSAVQRLLDGSPATWRRDSGVPDISLSGSLAQLVAAHLRTQGDDCRVQAADDRTPRALAVASSFQRPGGRLDFLRPRSVPGNTARNRRQRCTAAVLLGCLLLSGVLWLKLSQQSLHRELVALQQEQRQLQLFVDRGQTVVDRWSYISRWQRHRVDGATEIRRLVDLLPTPDRLIVTRLQLENLVDGAATVLRVDGQARQADDVQALNSAILEQAEHYELHPRGIEPAPPDSPFSSQFRLEVQLRTAGVRSGATP